MGFCDGDSGICWDCALIEEPTGTAPGCADESFKEGDSCFEASCADVSEGALLPSTAAFDCSE